MMSQLGREIPFVGKENLKYFEVYLYVYTHTRSCALIFLSSMSGALYLFLGYFMSCSRRVFFAGYWVARLNLLCHDNNSRLVVVLNCDLTGASSYRQAVNLKKNLYKCCTCSSVSGNMKRRQDDPFPDISYDKLCRN